MDNVIIINASSVIVKKVKDNKDNNNIIIKITKIITKIIITKDKKDD